MINQDINPKGIMRRFNPKPLLKIEKCVTEISENDKVALVGNYDIIREDRKRQYSTIFTDIGNECKELGLELTEKSALAIARNLSKTNITYSVIKVLGEELIKTLDDEIENINYFSIEPDEKDFLRTERLYKAMVTSIFPQTKDDIINAGSCIAFNLWTASVFHSMRILENGLKELASDLGIDSSLENWGRIIGDIDTKIKLMNEANTGKDWKLKRDYYSEAALQFTYFKDAWRNHVMHGSDNYNEEQAKIIFNHVKEFMEHLSIKH